MKLLKTILFLSLISLAVLFFSLFIIGRSGTIDHDYSMPRHVRVLWTQDPATHAMVSWTTLSHGRDHRVYYDTVSRGGDPKRYAFQAATTLEGRVTMKPMDREEGVPEAYYRHAELTELTPSTTYYLVVKSEGVASDEYHFVTAPADDRDLIILAGGDSRLGGPHPRYAGRTPHLERQGMKRLVGDLLRENPQVIAFVHGADYGSTADWRHLFWYFEDLELTAETSGGRLLPMIVSMGNHDTAIGFMENFYLGEEINGYTAFNYFYTTRLSAQVALITLNTEISLGGRQYHWLEEELPRVREDNRWLLINYHKPAFPAAKDPEDYRFARVREYWVPIFDRYKPDLVIESDGHCLKRTPPILNGEVDPDGIVYIGEGGLGAPLREPDMTRWYMQGGVGKKEFHVWKILIAADRLEMWAINMDGEVLDHHLIRK